jgi:aspartate/methionine/tyrosine aminotransferase
LVPGPYWSKYYGRSCSEGELIQYKDGYDIFFRIRASVRPVEVTVPDLGESLSSSLIPALESAFEKSPCPIKALVLANPHNPLGRCYSRDVLEMCLRFCNARRLHLISDEVFALSTFHSPDLPLPVFTSILSVDSAALGCDPSRVHAVWSTSKDFGSSGIKIVSTHAPGVDVWAS